MAEIKYIYTVNTENNGKSAFNSAEEAADFIKQNLLSEGEWMQVLHKQTYTVEKVAMVMSTPAKKPRKRA